MALKTRKNQPFTTTTRDSSIQGENIVFIKGGSTIIEDKWIQFNDLRVDLKKVIDDFIKVQARRIFNVKNGILYVVITLNKYNELEVIPSISLNQNTVGNVKVFESLVNKLPLMMVKLTHDGSNDLSSIIPITSEDIEVYTGYGNFTLRGPQGAVGPMGDTGANGEVGYQGITGAVGSKGAIGKKGVQGSIGAIGETGPAGLVGVFIPRFINKNAIDPVADFIAVPIVGEEGISVQFTNLSAGGWISVLWDFGDGHTSTDENPINVYETLGSYTVTLYVYGVANNSKKTKYNYINIVPEAYEITDVRDVNNPTGTWIIKVDELFQVTNSQFLSSQEEDVDIASVADSENVQGEFDNYTDDIYGAYARSFVIEGISLFVGTLGGGVYKTLDSGATWTASNSGLINLNVTSLAVSGSTLYAGTDGGGVFVSTNNGVLWTAYNEGLTNLSVEYLAVKSGNIFAGTLGDGVYVSSDGGHSWLAINAGIDNYYVSSIVVMSSNIFVSTYGFSGVFYSSDDGVTWTAVNNGLTNGYVNYLVVSGSALLAGTVGSGIFISSDSGATWTQSNTGITNLNVTCLVVVVSGSLIFAGTSGAGIFISNNNGVSWSAVNTGLNNMHICSIYTNGSILYAGTEDGNVYTSTDLGTSWTEVNNGLLTNTLDTIIDRI